MLKLGRSLFPLPSVKVEEAVGTDDEAKLCPQLEAASHGAHREEASSAFEWLQGNISPFSSNTGNQYYEALPYKSATSQPMS